MKDNSRQAIYKVGYLKQNFFSVRPEEGENSATDDFDSDGGNWSPASEEGAISEEQIDSSQLQDQLAEETIRECTKDTLERFSLIPKIKRILKGVKKMEQSHPQISAEDVETEKGVLNLNVGPVESPEGDGASGEQSIQIAGSAALLSSLERRAQIAMNVNPYLEGPKSTDLPALPLEQNSNKDIPQTPLSGILMDTSNKDDTIDKFIEEINNSSNQMNTPEVSPFRLRSGTVKSASRSSSHLTRSSRKAYLANKKAKKHKAEDKDGFKSPKRLREEKIKTNPENKRWLDMFGFPQDKPSTSFELERTEEDDKEEKERTDLENILDKALDNESESESESSHEDTEMLNQLLNLSKDNDVIESDSEFTHNTIAVEAMVHQSASPTPILGQEKTELTDLLDSFKSNIETTMLTLLEEHHKEIEMMVDRKIAEASKKIENKIEKLFSNYNFSSKIKSELIPVDQKIEKVNQELQHSIMQLGKKISLITINPNTTTSGDKIPSKAAWGNPKKVEFSPSISTQPIIKTSGLSSLSKLKRIDQMPKVVDVNSSPKDLLIDMRENDGSKNQQLLIPEQPKQELYNYTTVLEGLTGSIFLNNGNLDSEEFVIALRKKIKDSSIGPTFNKLDTEKKKEFLLKEIMRYKKYVKEKKSNLA